MTALIDFGPAIVGLLLTLLLADTAFNSRATARGWRILLPFGRPADRPEATVKNGSAKSVFRSHAQSRRRDGRFEADFGTLIRAANHRHAAAGMGPQSKHKQDHPRSRLPAFLGFDRPVLRITRVSEQNVTNRYRGETVVMRQTLRLLVVLNNVRS